MINSTHPVAPEEIMAWLDGELDAGKSQAVSEHIAGCAECSSALQLFQETSKLLSEWVVPNSPESIDVSIRQAIANPSTESRKPARRFFFLDWRVWVVGGIGMAVGFLLFVPRQESRRDANPRMAGYVADQLTSDLPHAPVKQRRESIAEKSPAIAASKMARAEMQNDLLATRSPDQRTPGPQSPMIARTAALTIQVRDLAIARRSLDAILSKHGGYSATLTFDTPENGQHHFQASLRIPAADLAPALVDLKALGRTLNETQSGEEVTQQHADLVARLQNSRETEERLRAILQQRTGKIEDVLQVEEEITRVRGEIESMEAEQKALEHRVDFAGVDVQLVEEYEEHFGSSPISTSGRLHNAFIQGMRNASGTLIGLVLFVEQYGPAALIWCVILGLPAYFAWRRYRKVRAMF